MAARNRVGLAEATRKRIQTTMLVERLQKHILGEVELSTTQIRAIEVLLNKTLPNLQATEIKAQVEEVKRVINANPMTDDEWERSYGNSLESTAGATKSTH